MAMSPIRWPIRYVPLVLGCLTMPAWSQLSCQQLDGAQVFSDAGRRHVYLGFFGTSNAADSIMNSGGTYGDSNNLTNSVRGEGRFGTAETCDPSEDVILPTCERFGTPPLPTHAARRVEATDPPIIVKDGTVLGRLTNNPAIDPAITLDFADACTGVDAFTSSVSNRANHPSPVGDVSVAAPVSSDFDLIGTLRVRWSTSGLNSAFPPATQFLIQTSLSPDGNRTDIDPTDLSELSADGGNGSALINGLDHEQSYFVWVTAVNDAGPSQLSLSDEGRPLYVRAGRPDRPLNLQATPGPEKISFRFDPPVENGGKPIIRYDYLLQVGDDPDSCIRPLRQAQVRGDANSVIVSPVVIDGLESATRYAFCVSACNVDQCSFESTTTSVAGQPAEPPDPPIIDRIEFDGAVLSVFFTHGAANGDAISSFSVDCGEGVTGSGVTSPLTVSGVREGDSYDCTITASNGAGTSIRSEVTSITAELVPAGLNLPLIIEAIRETP
ncbi:MAG: fibronectin type III domain-containing protein [Pseudomonadota bacterium]